MIQHQSKEKVERNQQIVRLQLVMDELKISTSSSLSSIIESNSTNHHNLVKTMNNEISGITQRIDRLVKDKSDNNNNNSNNYQDKSRYCNDNDNNNNYQANNNSNNYQANNNSTDIGQIDDDYDGSQATSSIKDKNTDADDHDDEVDDNEIDDKGAIIKAPSANNSDHTDTRQQLNDISEPQLSHPLPVLSLSSPSPVSLSTSLVPVPSSSYIIQPSTAVGKNIGDVSISSSNPSLSMTDTLKNPTIVKGNSDSSLHVTSFDDYDEEGEEDYEDQHRSDDEEDEEEDDDDDDDDPITHAPRQSISNSNNPSKIIPHISRGAFLTDYASSPEKSTTHSRSPSSVLDDSTSSIISSSNNNNVVYNKTEAQPKIIKDTEHSLPKDMSKVLSTQALDNINTTVAVVTIPSHTTLIPTTTEDQALSTMKHISPVVDQQISSSSSSFPSSPCDVSVASSEKSSSSVSLEKSASASSEKSLIQENSWDETASSVDDAVAMAIAGSTTHHQDRKDNNVDHDDHGMTSIAPLNTSTTSTNVQSLIPMTSNVDISMPSYLSNVDDSIVGSSSSSESMNSSSSGSRHDDNNHNYSDKSTVVKARSLEVKDPLKKELFKNNDAISINNDDEVSSGSKKSHETDDLIQDFDDDDHDDDDNDDDDDSDHNGIDGDNDDDPHINDTKHDIAKSAIDVTSSMNKDRIEKNDNITTNTKPINNQLIDNSWDLSASRISRDDDSIGNITKMSLQREDANIAEKLNELKDGNQRCLHNFLYFLYY